MKLDTKAVHSGEPRPAADRAITLPIYQSSTFEYGGEDNYDALRYIRLNNTPNHLCVGQKIAALEGVEAAVVTASGMAAISSALLALLGPGDHLLAQESLYGGTHTFLRETFPELGRKATLFSLNAIHDLEKHLLPETKAIYVESISNPMLEVPDLAAIAELAKKRRLIAIIDNTFPSPVNFRPAVLGYDVILHSATKYLNGHTDIVGGAIAGSKEIVHRVTHLINHLGGSMDPHTCFLLNRGLKTLGVRVRAQNSTALALSRALESHPKVERVLYPGLESHPDHARAKELFSGFGGMLSFVYRGNAAETDRMLKRLRLPYVAPSLGGVESLVTRPVTTSHSGVPRAERERLGIVDSLVRVSVGLEDAEDLVADFQEAL